MPFTFPTLSRDGRTLVFRKLFDLFAFDPTAADEPRKITISVEADDLPEPERLRDARQSHGRRLHE